MVAVFIYISPCVFICHVTCTVMALAGSTIQIKLSGFGWNRGYMLLRGFAAHKLLDEQSAVSFTAAIYNYLHYQQYKVAASAPRL